MVLAVDRGVKFGESLLAGAAKELRLWMVTVDHSPLDVRNTVSGPHRIDPTVRHADPVDDVVGVGSDAQGNPAAGGTS